MESNNLIYSYLKNKTISFLFYISIAHQYPLDTDTLC